ncbi:MAG: AraC family transcriptional regulator ligand-binding domain-containing protein [Pseudomonadota bacterium]
MHIHGSWVVALIEVLEATGCARAELMALMQLGEHDDVAQLRFPVHRIEPLWQLADERIGAQAGLQVAAHFRPQHWAQLGLGLLSSRNLGEIIERMTVFSRLMTDALFISMTAETPGTLTFRTRFAFPQPLEASRVEAYVGASLALVKMLIPQLTMPLRVDLMRAPPADASPWQAVFGEHLHWGHECVALHIAADDLQAAVPGADATIAAMHQAFLQRQLSELDDQTLVAQVRQALRHHLGKAATNIDNIAARLNTSGRTLQRRLQNAGVPFRDLLQQVRQELAQHYLSNTHLSLGDIAEQLGYRHHSNFTHAFRETNGCTPLQYRQQAQAAA